MDEVAEALRSDPELLDFWKELRTRKDLRLMFKKSKVLRFYKTLNASKYGLQCCGENKKIGARRPALLLLQ